MSAARWRHILPLVAVLLLSIGGSSAYSQTATPESDDGLGRSSYTPLEVPDALARFSSTFKRVARHVRPTVVYFEVEVPTRKKLSDLEEGPHDKEDLREFFDSPLQSSTGSGVIISENGYILTNHHVVDDAVNITARLHDKRKFEAEVIGVSEATDLAVVHIEGASDLPVAALGNSDQLEVGDWVVAVGNPFRLSSTVTAGIVSATGRSVNLLEGQLAIESFIQTDAAINPGSSGGALANLRGEVVGINTAIASRSGGSEGYGFAVPINLARRVASDLIRYGEFRRGYLGVSIQEVNDRQARDMGLRQIRGVLISDVVPGGAAAGAGLQAGDVVLTVNGTEVNAPNRLQTLIARHRPGDQVRLEVWRDGQRQRYRVRLFGEDNEAYNQLVADNSGPMREEEGSSVPGNWAPLEVVDAWGLGLRNLRKAQKQEFSVESGVYVAFVRGGSVSSSGGLPRDVVVTEVNDEPVVNVNELRRRLSDLADAHRPVLFEIRRRNGVAGFYEVVPPNRSIQPSE